MNARKFFALILILTLLATLTSAAGATPQAGPCAAGGVYDPACDVDHDGDVDIFDIQLAAGHWNQTGAWTSDNNHTHLGQTWTGSNNPLTLTGSYGYPDYAPLVLNTNGNGLRIISGAHGVLVDSVGGIGVFVNSAGTGVYVASANNDGVKVGSAGADGVKVYSAGSDGFAVTCAGNVSNCTSDITNANGFEVANAEDYGARVVYAGRAAFRSDDSGTNGLYVSTAGDSGVWVADATNWAGYFGGDINVAGNCTGCLIARLAINSGSETLQAGEIVAVDGVAASSFAGAEMLLRVRRATPGSPLLGVVSGRAEPYIGQEDGSTTLAPRPGQPAAPGEFLSVVIFGPVRVKAAGTVQVGDHLTVAEATGSVRALSTFQVQRTDGGLADIVEFAPSLGLALGPAEHGQVWVLVNPQ
ncbi:MAG: hypothetical protein WAV74_10575 [Anaerolineae bacterium]